MNFIKYDNLVRTHLHIVKDNMIGGTLCSKMMKL